MSFSCSSVLYTCAKYRKFLPMTLFSTYCYDGDLQHSTAKSTILYILRVGKVCVAFPEAPAVALDTTSPIL